MLNFSRMFSQIKILYIKLKGQDINTESLPFLNEFCGYKRRLILQQKSIKKDLPTGYQKLHCLKYVQVRSFFRSECGKMRTRKNSVFGRFSRSAWSLWCTFALKKYLCRSYKMFSKNCIQKQLKFFCDQIKINVKILYNSS